MASHARQDQDQEQDRHEAGDEQDDDYFLPLQHKRAFGGAGIKRKRIEFVPQSAPDTAVISSRGAPSKRPLGDEYLSIVLGKTGHSKAPHHGTPEPSASSLPSSVGGSDTIESNTIHGQHAEADESTSQRTVVVLCPVCNLPLESSSALPPMPHEASLAHQIHMAHSHPPSAVDRRSKGLAYLSSYGWDPDGRTGLGAAGREGRLYPVRAEVREDNRGIGAARPHEPDGDGKASGGGTSTRSAALQAPEKLDAKKRRQLAETQRKRHRDLNDLMYGRDDVNKYLGINL